ncbi:hypothetical protein FALCPG4_009423 [Fusarium falciforme]|nr:hypothetical protein NW757_001621 [Fusarium falciforme]
MGLGQTGLLEPAPTLNHVLFACLPWSGIAHKREKETRVGEKKQNQGSESALASSRFFPSAAACGPVRTRNRLLEVPYTILAPDVVMEQLEENCKWRLNTITNE